MTFSGDLKKMSVSIGEPISYSLVLNEVISLNELLGKQISITWTGIIHCQKCGVVTKKSFGEGFCYKCFVSAPEAAECIIRPEFCRAHLGEGRDPEWEERNHNQPHVVYLALSSAVKVGITRLTQLPTRWIDQGATKAIILAQTPNRYLAGMIEVALKDIYTDKTNWQRMLKNHIEEYVDLSDEKWELEEQLPMDLREYFTDDDEVIELHYPVIEYPEKVKSLKLDSQGTISGILTGIKGQYLMIDKEFVFNVRSHTGYEVELSF